MEGEVVIEEEVGSPSMVCVGVASVMDSMKLNGGKYNSEMMIQVYLIQSRVHQMVSINMFHALVWVKEKLLRR